MIAVAFNIPLWLRYKSLYRAAADPTRTFVLFIYDLKSHNEFHRADRRIYADYKELIIIAPNKYSLP